MDEETSAAGSSGGEIGLPTKWALEHAQLQSDVDTFVHQALAGLARAAEDLKQRIREETLAEVQGGQRERDAVLRDIEAARLELEELRAGARGVGLSEIEREREAILAEARAEAARVVESARESLHDEIRALQDQVREIRQQVQSQIGHGSGATPDPGSPAYAAAADRLARAEAWGASPSASHTVSTPASRPMPMATTVIQGQSESAGPRMMQLIFTNVPGYQRAAAIERATRQLPDVSNVDVQEFERGRLVLEVQLADPATVADAMVANGPAEMFVAEHSASAITFQLS